jgi:hypothetical protein
LPGRCSSIDLERLRSEIQATASIETILIRRVLQQCKSEGWIHADLLRCVLDFFAGDRKKV